MYHGHSKGVEIRADGTIEATWRDNGVPDDIIFRNVRGRLEATADGLAGTVTFTDDPDPETRLGDPIRVERADQYAISVHIGAGEILYVCTP